MPKVNVSKIQLTANKTRVFDPLADTDSSDGSELPMVVVYRGLGPEFDSSFAWDNPDWLMRQIVQSVSQDVLAKVVFAVPDSYTSDLTKCIQEATELIVNRGGTIRPYSLCGFSKGGGNVYKNKSLKDWKILGLIDPEPPGSSDVLDSVAAKIRCVYNFNNWARNEKLKDPVKNFQAHLKKLNVKMVDGADGAVQHPDMPALFFKTFGRDFT